MGAGRTGLALEARELWRESAGETTRLPGVEAREREREGFPVTEIRVLDRRGERALGKPPGRYVTLTLPGLERREPERLAAAARAVAAELAPLLPREGGILLAGLGNRAITPDALGPLAHDHTLVTRHLPPEALPPGSRPVAALSAGVLGTTGVESGGLVRAVAGAVRPACVVAVDALVSRSVERLCATVQLADTGIVPGSGVGNHRQALDRKTVGVPVIAVGAPTVVDGATLAADLLGLEEVPPAAGRDLMVTPRDIDSRVADLGRIIGHAVSLAANPGLALEELELLLR